MPLRSWTDIQLTTAVSTSTRISEVARKLGLKPSSARHLRRHIVRLKLDTSHLITQHRPGDQAPLSSRLTLKSGADSSWLKARIVQEGLQPEECSVCGLGPTWRDLPLTLQLDHINGDHSDNRLENLRLLCPNCHTQTPTWGRGRKRARCPCGNLKVAQTRRCAACKAGTAEKRWTSTPKINWPSIEKLTRSVDETSYAAVASELGVSAPTVRKHVLRGKVPEK